MKVLVKTNSESTVLVLPDADFIDSSRYRVKDIYPVMDNWEGRNLISLFYVDDEANDDDYKAFIKEFGSDSPKEYIKKFEKKEEVVAEIKEEVVAEVKEEAQPKTKSRKGK